MTHGIEGQKKKRINMKLEDEGLNVGSIRGWKYAKHLCRMQYLTIYCPRGQGNGNVIRFSYESGKEMFGIWKPGQFNVPGWNERAKELNARYREAVSNWNISRRPRSGPLAELKCRARAVFRHEMKFLKENEDQLRSQSMLSKLQRGECKDFWKEIKALSLRRNPCH